MTAARELSLRVDVKNVDDLNKLTEFVKALRTAGPVARGSMREAAEASRGLQTQLAELSKSVTGGFSSLSTELAKLSAGISTMGKAAETAQADITKAVKTTTAAAKSAHAEQSKSLDDSLKFQRGLMVGSMNAENRLRDQSAAAELARAEKNATFLQRLKNNSVVLHMREQERAAAKAAAAELANAEKHESFLQRLKNNSVAMHMRDQERAAAKAAAAELANAEKHESFLQRLKNNSVAMHMREQERAAAKAAAAEAANAEKNASFLQRLKNNSVAMQMREQERAAAKAAAAELASAEKHESFLQRLKNNSVAMHMREQERAAAKAAAAELATAEKNASFLQRLKNNSVAMQMRDQERAAAKAAAAEAATAEKNASFLQRLKNNSVAMQMRDQERAAAKAAAAELAGAERNASFLQRVKNNSVAMQMREQERAAAAELALAEKNANYLQRLQNNSVALRMREQAKASAELAQQERKAALDAERARKLDAAYNSAGTTDRSRFGLASKAQAYMGAGGSAAGAAAAYGSSAAAAAQDSAAMARLAASIGSVTAAQKDKTQGATAAAAASKQHSLAVKQANEAYMGLHSTLRGMAGGFGQVWLSWGRPLAALWAGFAVSTGVRESFKQFSAFEQQLSIIGAIAGETTATVDALGVSIIKMGTQGSRGPQELAEGLRVLTQAGLSATNALNVLPQVSKFATVAEMQLPAAAQSLLGIATAFGKTTSDLNSTADVIGKAAAISQTSVEGMTAAIRQGSTVAEQYGARIEDVSGVLAVLAKRNIEASAAGTAIRNAYNEIYAPTSKAKEAMDKLGVSAYDAATKQMKPLVAVFEELKPKLEALDKQSQNQFLQIVFGERGGKVGSAILSDLNAVKDAIETVGSASGFIEKASVQIENSVENRWKNAMNTLKASAIAAGAGAEESIRSLIENLRIAFGSEEFKQGLSALVSGFAQFVSLLTKHAGTIATVFGVYLGVKVAAGLRTIALGIVEIAAAKGAMAASASTAAVALNAEALAAERARIAVVGLQGAQTGLAATTIAAGTAFATAAGAVARFLPYVGLVVTAVMAGAEAWAYFKRKKEEATSGLPTEGRTLAASTKKLVEYTKRQAAESRQMMEWAGPEGAAAPDANADLFRANVDNLYKARAEALREVEDRYSDPKRRTTRDAAIGLSPKAFAEQGKAAAAAVEAKYDALIAAERKGQKEYEAAKRSLEEDNKARDSYQQQKNRLKVGGEAVDFSSGSKGGKGAGTYLRANAEGQLANLELTAIEKQYERAAKYVQAYRDANLISEEAYQEKIADLREQQWIDEAEAANNYLKKILPALRAEALGKLKAGNAEGRASIESQYEARVATTQARLAENQAAARNDATMRNIKLEGRNKQMDDFVSAAESKDISNTEDRGRTNIIEAENLRAKILREEEMRDIRANAEMLPAVARRVAERRLDIENEFSQKIKEAQKNNNTELVAMYERLQEELTDIALESVERRAEYERSFAFGAQRALRTYIDEVENTATAGESLVQRTTKSVEDFFVSMATSGKMSFQDLINSVIADLARLAAQKSITGPLANILFNNAPGMLASASAFFMSSAPTGAALTGVGAAPYHSGGIVGRDGGMTRNVPLSLFSGAPRYHGGGVIGANEVPIIAERGERVLTKNQQLQMESALSGRSLAPEVQVNVINNGTAQQVANTETQFDGKKMIVNVILEDLSRNGPISRRMSAVRS